ncbi:hypothetical protein NIES970_23020 [[Synechococcus] sp. NIES-970]|uniref:DUF1816 domain-containing protein n=1 Tax=Picosynechococcus sp. NKBG15041c TaxID=1407650 RepID=UPI0003FE3127|nr:DUF1816 domain-containing protein [Picosynechococcus sp. NKBG15041c]BAW97351.1 hypothetical protein NIES970_23020 [[Synechococcus] sp. NIES-970]
MTGLIIFGAYALVLSWVFYYLNQPYGRHWWLKITTAKPFCVYYFGPFVSEKNARAHLPGYQADLEQERAQITQIVLNQMMPPAQLTICPEDI